MRSLRGFTLIEVLVASAIAALFVGLLGATLSATLHADEMIRAHSELDTEGRALLRIIAADVSAAIYPADNMESFLGEDSLKSGMPADSIHLLSASQPLLAGAPPCEVSYIPRERSGRITLVRREAWPADRRITVGGTETEIASSLVALDFRYFDGSAWRDSWSAQSEGYLPVAVRADVRLLPTEGVEPLSFSDVILVLSGGKRETN